MTEFTLRFFWDPTSTWSAAVAGVCAIVCAGVCAIVCAGVCAIDCAGICALWHCEFDTPLGLC